MPSVVPPFVYLLLNCLRRIFCVILVLNYIWQAGDYISINQTVRKRAILNIRDKRANIPNQNNTVFMILPVLLLMSPPSFLISCHTFPIHLRLFSDLRPRLAIPRMSSVQYLTRMFLHQIKSYRRFGLVNTSYLSMHSSIYPFKSLPAAHSSGKIWYVHSLSSNTQTFNHSILPVLPVYNTMVITRIFQSIDP